LFAVAAPLDLGDHLLAQIGMAAARAPGQWDLGLRAVPRPQSAKRLAANLVRFVIQSVAKKSSAEVAGLWDATMLDQDLQRADADILLAGAQGQFGQCELRRRRLRFGDRVEGRERTGAHQRIGIVEQPG
jgi:hypothetical protein